MNQSLATLPEHIYSRSDVAYRTSLVREYLEFVFFTKRDSAVTSSSLDAFATAGTRSVADIAFLREIPISFFETLTPDTFYSALETLTQDAKLMPTLSLSVPVVLAADDVEALGKWLRHSVDPHLLIDIDVDPAIAVGCRLVWQNRRHDYSIDHFFQLKRSLLDQLVTGHASAAPSA